MKVSCLIPQTPKLQIGMCQSEKPRQTVTVRGGTLAVEVDRILADISLNRTSYKMPMFGAKSLGLYYAKGQDSNGGTRDKNEINTVNKPTSIHEKVRPSQDLLSCANKETTATTSIGGGSSVAFPIMYDASEEDLMNTIEREFG
ncbi:hypothetical protein Q8A67_019204 [Cirrhinus molitorella]|uniref:Uncharacterized protein n=1 Tax=Cirrhinus molitorella TaxID=172907 RepID=A0AA88TPI1_9TELE|nr:hypothetical protein Q8A67_019204 [Cirrhinus molitorella]